ncbi:hypothetical protein BDW66DRAFT_135590 [Aspergillus desertorum]
MCNLGSGIEEHRAWKTTRVYGIIGNHPRLVRFISRGPWTVLPILEKPWSTLEGFLEERYDAMYAPRGEGGSRSYLKPPYRPLIFHWALQVLTALSFIHSKDVILGNLQTHVCWPAVTRSNLHPRFPLTLYTWSQCMPCDLPTILGAVNTASLSIPALFPAKGNARQLASQPCTLRTRSR